MEGLPRHVGILSHRSPSGPASRSREALIGSTRDTLMDAACSAQYGPRQLLQKRGHVSVSAMLDTDLPALRYFPAVVLLLMALRLEQSKSQ